MFLLITTIIYTRKKAHLITISNKLIDKYYKDHTDNV